MPDVICTNTMTMKTVIGILILIGIIAIVLEILEFMAGFILFGIGIGAFVVALIVFLIWRASRG